jgi:hypothetical protein
MSNIGRRANILGLGLFAYLLAGCVDSQAADDTAERPLIDAPPDRVATQDPASARYAAFAAVVARHQAMSDRVAQISHRLRVANAPLCNLTQPDIGLITHQLSDYPEGIRPLALHFMDLEEEGRFIRAVIPGSPAEAAALSVGDQILEGWPVQDDGALRTDRGAFALDAVPACVAPTLVINAAQPNASTDGREILLSTALVEDVSDDAALAFIIAHEMAHLLRGHRPDGSRWVAELQADADALTLLSNAGYDVVHTVAGWEAGVEAHRETQSMSATHPPLRIRMRNLEAALRRLQARPEGFKMLAD